MSGPKKGTPEQKLRALRVAHRDLEERYANLVRSNAALVRNQEFMTARAKVYKAFTLSLREVLQWAESASAGVRIEPKDWR